MTGSLRQMAQTINHTLHRVTNTNTVLLSLLPQIIALPTSPLPSSFFTFFPLKNSESWVTLRHRRVLLPVLLDFGLTLLFVSSRVSMEIWSWVGIGWEGYEERREVGGEERTVHRSSSGTLSMTPGTCLPQPHHVFLPVSYYQQWPERKGEVRARGGEAEIHTASIARCCFAHLACCFS
jgi:hypothetical protein